MTRHEWPSLFPPRHSPDLNPIQRIWITSNARWFNHYVSKTVRQLLERLNQAILDVIKHPNQTKQTTAIGTLFWRKS